MKIDRLIGILTLLLQKDKLTVSQLAERFEVSRRTILRDLDAIGKAGIPLVTMPGANGGVSILNSYKLDKTLLTGSELRAIFTGLSSLDSVSKGRTYQNMMEKLSGPASADLPNRSMAIDLSAHYKDTLAPKIELLQASIASETSVSFVYHSQKGEHRVQIDPYLTVFQWGNWYILGFEHSSNQYKLYKLNRICGIQQSSQVYEKREIPAESLDFNACFSHAFQAIILFDASVKYRLIEEYGSDSFVETPDGMLRFTFPFTHADYLLTWVLGFGEKAELLEPSELRSLLRDRLKLAFEKYLD